MIPVIHAEWVIWNDPNIPNWRLRCRRLGYVSNTINWPWPPRGRSA